MKFYASTSCLANNDLDNLLSQFSSVGVRHIELGPTVQSGFSARLLSQYGGRYLLHACFPPPENAFVINIASLDPLIRNRSLDQLRTSIDLAAELSIPFISIHPGSSI
jgi:sugar phosphate isomerase/epimerase